jgi:hypothetical protein
LQNIEKNVAAQNKTRNVLINTNDMMGGNGRGFNNRAGLLRRRAVIDFTGLFLKRNGKAWTKNK